MDAKSCITYRQVRSKAISKLADILRSLNCSYIFVALDNQCHQNKVDWVLLLYPNKVLLIYTYSVFVFNSNRWRYCQMQPRKFETEVKKLQIFSSKSLLRYFKSDIGKNNDLMFLFTAISSRIKIILVTFCTNAI